MVGISGCHWLPHNVRKISHTCRSLNLVSQDLNVHVEEGNVWLPEPLQLSHNLSRMNVLHDSDVERELDTLLERVKTQPDPSMLARTEN